MPVVINCFFFFIFLFFIIIPFVYFAFDRQSTVHSALQSTDCENVANRQIDEETNEMYETNNGLMDQILRIYFDGKNSNVRQINGPQT